MYLSCSDTKELNRYPKFWCNFSFCP